MTGETGRSHLFYFPPSHPRLCPILQIWILYVRPIGLSHHLMEGKGELTTRRQLSHPKEVAELMEPAVKPGSGIVIEIRLSFGSLCEEQRGA